MSRDVTDLVGAVSRQASVFEDWLAAPVRRDRSAATAFYAAFRAWSAAIERRAKHRKLLVCGIQKNPILTGHFGAAILALYDALAAFSLGVELALKRLGRDVLQGRQDDVFKNDARGGRLGQHRLKGLIKGHPNSPVVVEPSGEAESAGRGTVSPTTSPEARP